MLKPLLFQIRQNLDEETEIKFDKRKALADLSRHVTTLIMIIIIIIITIVTFGGDGGRGSILNINSRPHLVKCPSKNSGLDNIGKGLLNVGTSSY